MVRNRYQKLLNIFSIEGLRKTTSYAFFCGLLPSIFLQAQAQNYTAVFRYLPIKFPFRLFIRGPLLFALLFLQTLLVAQRLSAPKPLTIEDGLCFRDVTSIVQDHQGLIWFGTHNGLSRFDGYRFLNFGDGLSFDKHFPANDFNENALLFINDSTLWAIADKQLFAMNTNTFQTIPVQGWEGKAVKMRSGENRDILLVSNYEGKHILWRFTEENGFREVAKVPISRFGEMDLEIDEEGHFWWSTMSHGLQEFNTNGELLKEVKVDSFNWHGDRMYYTDFIIGRQNRFFFLFEEKKPTT